MNKIYNKNTFLLLFVIAAISLNLRLGITSVGPLMDTIRTSLSLSNAQASLLTTVPVLCMGIFASLATVLNKKYGSKFTLILMLSVLGVATALRGFVPGFSTLLITAFLIGLAIAVLGPTMSSVIKKYFPGHAAIAIGISTFFMSMGSAASAAFTGIFFEVSDSFMFALAIWSAFALFGVLVVAFVLKTGDNSKLPKQEVSEVKYKFPSPWKQLKPYLFMLFYALQAAIYFSTITWLVPMSVENGMTMIQGGMLLSAVMSVQVIFNLLLPIMMEKYPARRNWIYFILAAGTAATLLFWTGDHTLMWIAAFMMGIPLGGLYSAALMLPLDETLTANGANSWTAMMQTGGCIIGGLFPFVIGFIYDSTQNHNYTMTILLVIYVLAFILITIIGNKKENNFDKFIVEPSDS
ncbi:MFS transporter [Jeotgalicoccus coquinae]|uniref:CP family cyanate transporter-like MFS transporter n=2 Tax=Jeotgalicoccus TaxID=227979 RepID=A0A6V7RLK3_9STAP|nr:MFS transporter [Jeotgalicoccus coquinae]MBB6422232.1 CP family cyanate transporter-like MFS transporter [Jeotgalicoccus coquinae]GGE17597.1 MFS transporter [Jeotgalicoccus coquinae]CAD2079216.1 putative transporter YycB [Jeotgalicoccus coquinae]